MQPIISVMPNDERAERRLRQLASNARTGRLDILDWERFYWFVVTAATCRKRWSASDVTERMQQLGVSADRAEELGDLHGHCRAVLYIRGKGKRGSTGWSFFLG
jgi:hypothetical protein